MLLRDIKEFSEAVTLFEKAIDGYAESGSLDTAAMTVEKAADVLKNDDPRKALAVSLPEDLRISSIRIFQIYQRGLALVQQSDRAKMASQFLKQITKLHLQLNEFKDALGSIREEIEKFVEIREYPRIGQLGIGLVLVDLALEDSVAALKDYSWVVGQSPDFQHSEDGRVCENLIGYYDASDNESFQNVLKCGALRSMDNEYLRLMKNLKAPSDSAGTVDALEDEEDEGLCWEKKTCSCK